MSGGEEGEGASLEFTPTWVIAAVCSVIVAISLAAERFLHYTGKYLKNKDQKPLYEALQKVKEELMLLGFISLMLTVFQGRIVKICVPPDTMKHMLPCSLSHESSSAGEAPNASPDSSSHHRRLLAVEAAVNGYCAAKIRQWKHWENSIANSNGQVLKPKFTDVHQHDFIKKRFLGLGTHSVLLSWLHAFFKQFYGSVTKTDYTALRLGFIMTHCRGNPKFNFHKYMIRALEADFKTVVGIRLAYLLLDCFSSFRSSTGCWHQAGAYYIPVGSRGR